MEVPHSDFLKGYISITKHAREVPRRRLHVGLWLFDICVAPISNTQNTKARHYSFPQFRQPSRVEERETPWLLWPHTNRAQVSLGAVTIEPFSIL